METDEYSSAPSPGKQPPPGMYGQPHYRNPIPKKRKFIDYMREEFKPISGGLSGMKLIDTLLKKPGQVVYQIEKEGPAGLLSLFLFISVLCFGGYGLIVGMFNGGHQIWAAPLKIALGSVACGLICLPNLYIFTCLGRGKQSLYQLAAILGAMITLNGILLLGFAPISWLFTQATESVGFMGILHLAFWCLGLIFSVRLALAALTIMNGRESGFVVWWALVYILVSLQMSTSLRPLLGAWKGLLPGEKKFFVEHWMSLL